MDNQQLQSLKDLVTQGDLQLTPLADGSGVMLNLNKQQVLSLNATGRFILESLIANDQSDLEQLAAALSDEFEVSQEQGLSDTVAFLRSLAELLAPH